MGPFRSSVVLFIAIYVVCSSNGTITKENDDQERSWYAPSRKAHLHAYKYQSAIQNLNRLAKTQGADLRLPTDVVPIRYELRLLPIIEEGNFTTYGHVDILVECKKSTDKIVLNAAELIITESSIKVVHNGTNEIIKLNEFSEDQNNTETVTAKLNATLEAGTVYKISMDFTSILNDKLVGFYRSSYEENGAKKWLAVSQMEAPDARRAFPCFDEPSMKAEFSVVLGRKQNMKAISNMPPLSANPSPENPVYPELPPGYVWDYFETSVKMSSYLVAFMVSEFAKVDSPAGLSTTKFAIWARPSFQHQTHYSATLGPKILEYFAKDYFNISFPLPKVDMAAIPDFAAGAMENWGLVTYREADLLYDPRLSSASAKQRVAVIIAHELAHQWFGNLVTMEWWNVLWLNEGFASYMEYPGTHAVEPDMEMDEQFTVADLHYVFFIDALESSRPIDFAVNTPDEINQMFDAISYEKGSCIIRMCANFMTEPVFRQGIRDYLNKHAYGNTVQDDLWAALQVQAENKSIALPATVKTIMDSWTSQMGYPVVHVKRNYDANMTAEVSQERFLLFKNASAPANSSSSYLWHIPLTFTSDFSTPTPPIQWLEKTKSKTIQLSQPVPNNKWVIFNVGQESYYRVLYDEKNLGFIKDQLMSDHSKISKKNRAQLLDDYLNAARAGLVTYPTALELTRYLNNEKDYAPWTAASAALDFIDVMLYGSDTYNSWKYYMLGPVSALYDYVKFEESAADAHLKNFTRSTAVNWACLKLDHQDCKTKAKADYDAWMKKPNNDDIISPNLRRLISCTAMAFGGNAEYQFGFEQYSDSTMANEKTDMLRAITCPRDPYILLRLLNRMIDPNGGIHSQDTVTLFRNIALNPVGHEVAMDFIAEQWNSIYTSTIGYLMPNFFRALCDRVNTKEKLDKLKKIYTEHQDVLVNSQSVRQGLELAEANVKWVDENKEPIKAWLQNIATETPPATVTSSTVATTTPAQMTSASITTPASTTVATAATTKTTHAASSIITETTHAATTQPNSASNDRISGCHILVTLILIASRIVL